MLCSKAQMDIVLHVKFQTKGLSTETLAELNYTLSEFGLSAGNFQLFEFGRSGRNRTCDILHPMQVRYLAALHPDTNFKTFVLLKWQDFTCDVTNHAEHVIAALLIN